MCRKRPATGGWWTRDFAIGNVTLVPGGHAESETSGGPYSLCDGRLSQESLPMFDQVFDNFRKASEMTLQAQQDLFHQWMSQWPRFPLEITTPGNKVSVNEQARSFQKQWTDTATALMTKHCEALDAQYRAGIRTIEAALRTTEAKSPEEFRRLTEELWRKSFEVLKQTIENQIRDFQIAVEKWSELMTQQSPKV